MCIDILWYYELLLLLNNTAEQSTYYCYSRLLLITWNMDGRSLTINTYFYFAFPTEKKLLK